MAQDMQPSELRLGDVLLLHGSSFLDKLIIELDGSPYSHAALYYDQNHVAESVQTGVVRSSLYDCFFNKFNGDPAKNYIDVYRYKSDSGEILGSANYPVAPIIKKANDFLSQHDRYAYERLLLLAIILPLRKLPDGDVISEGLGEVLKAMMSAATEILNKIFQSGKEPMICSELVHRCFCEAQGDKYIIRIKGLDTNMTGNIVQSLLLKSNVDEHSKISLELHSAASNFLATYMKVKQMDTLQTMNPGVIFPVDSAFVTPRNLSESSNLVLQGRLDVSNLPR